MFVSGCNIKASTILATLDELDVRIAARSKTLPIVPQPYSKPFDPLVPKTETVHFPSESEAFCVVEVESFVWECKGLMIADCLAHPRTH